MTIRSTRDLKVRGGAIRWIVRETAGNLILIVLLFGIVGRWDWWAGWALSSNAFFVATVRIQADRGQTVVSGGPYRYVRHPGYLGSILLHLGVPFLLGSLWALIPGFVAVLVMVVRTALEDRTLRAELSGYEEYAERVRYRLLPGVW
jgi:protein-S-isoprenylcysteine O-methyltransferase Ste14